MSTFLFDKIVFGPVHSRRLGVSLGINLLPLTKKYCNFNCIYCECGWSNLQKTTITDLPSRSQIRETLSIKLDEMNRENRPPDVITFAGNGEPTMHPEFAGIIDDTINIRNRFCPGTQIAVLTNSTLVFRKEVMSALSKIDQCILKLDTVNPETFKILNCPAPGIDLDMVIHSLVHFPGRKIIQTMFLRGLFGDVMVDNTTNEEISGLLNAYSKINPERVMIYSFERDTAARGLIKVPVDELEEIGRKMERGGVRVEVS